MASTAPSRRMTGGAVKGRKAAAGVEQGCLLGDLPEQGAPFSAAETRSEVVTILTGAQHTLGPGLGCPAHTPALAWLRVDPRG